MVYRVFAYDSKTPGAEPIEVRSTVRDLSRPYHQYERVDCIDVSTAEVVASYTRGVPKIWAGWYAKDAS